MSKADATPWTRFVRFITSFRPMAVTALAGFIAIASVGAAGTPVAILASAIMTELFSAIGLAGAPAQGLGPSYWSGAAARDVLAIVLCLGLFIPSFIWFSKRLSRSLRGDARLVKKAQSGRPCLIIALSRLYPYEVSPEETQSPEEQARQYGGLIDKALRGANGGFLPRAEALTALEPFCAKGELIRPNWSWQQPLRSIVAQLQEGRLSEVRVVATKDSARQFPWFEEFLAPLTASDGPFRLTLTLSADNAELDDYRALDEVYREVLDDAIDKHGSSRSIVVDITGGQRLGTIAAVLATCRDDALLAYITSESIRPIYYDLRVERAHDPNSNG
jgi:CRISPR-associated protein (Cas_Cas02710)